VVKPPGFKKLEPILEQIPTLQLRREDNGYQLLRAA